MKNKLQSCVYFFPKNSNTNTNTNTNINENTKKKKKYNNLLVKNSFWINNELTNIDKLYYIERYNNYFYMPENINYLKVAEYNSYYDVIDYETILSNDESILFKFENANIIYFKTYLKTTPKQFILRLLDSFETLLGIISILEQQKIFHNNIKMDTILYNEDTSNLLLSNFRYSINLDSDLYNDNLGEYLKHFFIAFEPNYNEWTLELHILSFMLTNKLDSLSYYNIEYIINEVAKHSIIHKFNKTIIDEFVSSSLKYFEKYINKTYDTILFDILNYTNTWDTYALSLLYLNILIDIHNKLENKANKFIILFMKLLVNNLHFNPEKRLSATQTSFNFKLLLEDIDKSYYIELLKEL
jgi:hypothetical protein